MDFHPAALIFPVDDENIDALADDIRANGLKQSIQLLDGKILDGRRRWQACKMAGVEPRTEDVETDDPIKHVLSLNLHRRHLTVSQRSMVADKVRAFYDTQAKERMQSGGGDKKSNDAKSGMGKSPYPIGLKGSSRDAAGATVGIGGNAVDQARHVRRDGIPELCGAVESGKISVNAAREIARLPQPEQPAALSATLAGEPRPYPLPEEPHNGDHTRLGVGVIRANEAIDCLKRIPKKDGLRARGFQIVSDWIKHNK